jgi:hypothetical protein
MRQPEVGFEEDAQASPFGSPHEVFEVFIAGKRLVAVIGTGAPDRGDEKDQREHQPDGKAPCKFKETPEIASHPGGW